MRTLSSYERDLIAGGTLTGSTDGTGGGGSSEPEIDVSSYTVPSHPLVTPGAFAGELGAFFDAVGETLDAGAQAQYDGQNSSPEQYQNYGSFDQGFTNVYEWVNSLRDNPAAAYWQYLTGDVDPEFLLETITPSYMAGSYRSGYNNPRGGVTMQMVDASRAVFNLNGQIIYGEYHSGNAGSVTGGYDSAGTATEIVVTGAGRGYWTVSNSLLPGFPSNPSPPPAATSSYGAGPVTALPPGWNTAVDGAIDKAASHLAAQIKAKPDFDHYEYSAIVWVDTNGVMHESLVIRGNKTDTGLVSWADYGVPSNAGAFKIVARIHNHPYYYPAPIGPAGTYVDVPNGNRVYVDNYDLGSMQTLATNGYSVNGVNMMRTYIQHDNVVDKYNFVQNSGALPPLVGPAQPLPLAPKAVFSPAP